MPKLFDGVGCFADTGGIDEAEGDTSKIHGVFNDVAGGAMNVAHDGTFFVQEGIQQGGLTGICFANDSHGHSVLQSIAHAERIYQVMDNLLNLTGDVFQFRTVGKLQFLVVAEVEFQPMREVRWSSLSRRTASSRLNPPRIWFMAMRWVAAEVDAMRSATASAWLRSILPFKKAR